MKGKRLGQESSLRQNHCESAAYCLIDMSEKWEGPHLCQGSEAECRAEQNRLDILYYAEEAEGLAEAAYGCGCMLDGAAYAQAARLLREKL